MKKHLLTLLFLSGSLLASDKMQIDSVVNTKKRKLEDGEQPDAKRRKIDQSAIDKILNSDDYCFDKINNLTREDFGYPDEFSGISLNLKEEHKNVFNKIAKRGIDSAFLLNYGLKPTPLEFNDEDLINDDAVIAISPDGNFIVTITPSDSFLLWDVRDLSDVKVKKLEGEAHRYTVVSFSPSGEYLIATTENHTATLWNISDFNNISTHILTGHTDWVITAAFSPDGKYFLTGSDDKTVKIWDLQSLKEIASIRLTGHHIGISKITISPNCKYVLVTYRDGKSILWDISDLNQLSTRELTKSDTKQLRGDPDNFNISFSPNSKYIIAHHKRNNTALLWDISNLNNIVFRELKENFSIDSVAFSPNCKYIATNTGYLDTDLDHECHGTTLLDITDLNNIISSKKLSGHFDPISTDFSHNNNYMVRTEQGNMLALHNICNFDKLLSKELADFSYRKVKFSPDTKYIVAAGSNIDTDFNKVVNIYNLNTWIANEFLLKQLLFIIKLRKLGYQNDFKKDNNYNQLMTSFNRDVQRRLRVLMTWKLLEQYLITDVAELAMDYVDEIP